jgi:hypothetical protein
MLVVVKRLITAFAATAFLGVTAPATARIERAEFDAVLRATLERSWTWQESSSCGDDVGEGRRVVTIRTARPVPVAKNGGTIPVVGSIEVRGLAETWEETPDGSCVQRVRSCPRSRASIAGSIRLTVRGNVLRLGNLRYRVSGRVPCVPPEVSAVTSALRNDPRFESVPVRDRTQKLRNQRIPRVTVTASSRPASRLTGDVTGEVRAAVSWSLVLSRR